MEKIKEKLEAKWNDAKQEAHKAAVKAGTVCAKAVKFAKENPMVTVAFLGAVTKGVTTTSRFIRDKREQDAYDRRYYDKRTGRYEWTRYKPSRKQATLINERHLNGECYREIFEDMGILGHR